MFAVLVPAAPNTPPPFPSLAGTISSRSPAVAPRAAGFRCRPDTVAHGQIVCGWEFAEEQAWWVDDLVCD